MLHLLYCPSDLLPQSLLCCKLCLLTGTLQAMCSGREGSHIGGWMALQATVWLGRGRGCI